MLTTKCPMFLQLTRGPTRQARIAIQWKPSKLQRPLFPALHFDDETWHTIPDSLLQAQDFILQQYNKDIASDLITLHIQGPNYAYLSLLDLPGLVYTKAEHEDVHMIRDIQSLLDEHLSNPRCILLAVVPANVDFHNSTVMAEALKRDKSTERTIPVITKPDLIDPGAEGQVLDLLQGKKVTFQLGFHMVKGRGQASLDQQHTIDDGLQDEEQYFDQVEPWKSVLDRSLLGTNNLRDKLATLLVKHTRQQIPGILHEIRNRKRVLSDMLELMGPPHTNTYDRRRYFQDVCQTIVSRLEATLTGKGRVPSRSQSAAAKLHEAIAMFVEQIQQSSLSTVGQVTEGAPVIVFHPRGIIRGEVVHLDEVFACVDHVDDDDADSEALFELTDLQSLEELVEENTVWSDGSKVNIARKDHRFDTLRKIPLHQIRSDPSWLKAKIQENRTDDLPCFLNSDTFKAIVSDFIEEDWKPHCVELLDKTRTIITEVVQTAVGAAFASDRYQSLKFSIEKQCRITVDAVVASAMKQVLSHLEMEKHPYTSQADDLYKDIAEVRQSRLKRELESALRVDQEGVFDTQAIKAIVDRVFERSRQTSMDDHLAEEMELILRAYGSVATKRVLDRMPMISWEIFRSLSKSIRDTLTETRDEALDDCMQEVAEFTIKYKQASEELAALNTASGIFETLI